MHTCTHSAVVSCPASNALADSTRRSHKLVEFIYEIPSGRKKSVFLGASRHLGHARPGRNSACAGKMADTATTATAQMWHTDLPSLIAFIASRKMFTSESRLLCRPFAPSLRSCLQHFLIALSFLVSCWTFTVGSSSHGDDRVLSNSACRSHLRTFATCCSGWRTKGGSSLRQALQRSGSVGTAAICTGTMLTAVLCSPRYCRNRGRIASTSFRRKR